MRKINLIGNYGTFGKLLRLRKGDVLVVKNIVLENGKIVEKKYKCLSDGGGVDGI